MESFPSIWIYIFEINEKRKNYLFIDVNFTCICVLISIYSPLLVHMPVTGQLPFFIYLRVLHKVGDITE